MQHNLHSQNSKETARTYDRMSGWYDLLSGPAEKKLRLAGLQRLELEAGETLLEIGPGTGTSLVEAGQRISPEGLVVGVDLSFGMCQVSQQRLQEGSSSRRKVAILQGDAHQLPFRSGTFDAVFMSFTLELFPQADFSIVLAEIRRVAAEKRRVGIVSLVQSEPAPWMEQAYSWLHQRFPTILDCRPIALDTILVRNGFSITNYEVKSMFGLPVALAVCI